MAACPVIADIALTRLALPPINARGGQTRLENLVDLVTTRFCDKATPRTPEFHDMKSNGARKSRPGVANLQ